MRERIKGKGTWRKEIGSCRRDGNRNAREERSTEKIEREQERGEWKLGERRELQGEKMSERKKRDGK